MRGKLVLGILTLLLASVATRSDAAKVVYQAYSPYVYPYPYPYPYSYSYAAPVVVPSQAAPIGSAQGVSAQSAAINGVLAILIDRLANRPGAGSVGTGGSMDSCRKLTASVEKLSESVDKLNSLLSGLAKPAPDGGGKANGFNPVPGGGLDAALNRFNAQLAAAQSDPAPVTIDLRLALDALAKQENQPDRQQFLKWALANELIETKAAAAHNAKVDALIKAIEAVPVP